VFRRAIAGLVCGAVAYRLLVRHRVLTWGATRDEAAARLPGDELLEDAAGVATRAITIDAPASAVWPWLAQMGPAPRGGAYTYDWVENRNRFRLPRLRDRLGMIPMESGSLVMERKMLRGIKQRAEQLASAG
jgi:hypothetical protein